MDSKNIIEEIDIIIRAKVEEARKDIRSVVKETEKMVSSVSGNMKKLDKSGQLDSFRKGLENARDELENLEEEVREIGVTMDGVKFKFNPKIEGDFTKQYEKAIEEAEMGNSDREQRHNEIQQAIQDRENHRTEYDESIVRQMIECIKVYPQGKLQIIFGGGYKVEESI